jgi:hypothetical protein
VFLITNQQNPARTYLTFRRRNEFLRPIILRYNRPFFVLFYFLKNLSSILSLMKKLNPAKKSSPSGLDEPATLTKPVPAQAKSSASS